jgi:sulfite reductase (ferredoxin)
VLDEAGLGELDVRVNITGCPNGCARPYTAEIGIVGRTKTGYDVYVGGAVGGDRLAERIATGVKLADLPAVLGPVTARFAAERGPDEGFGDWCARVRIADEPPAVVAVPIRRRAARAVGDPAA